MGKALDFEFADDEVMLAEDVKSMDKINKSMTRETRKRKREAGKPPSPPMVDPPSIKQEPAWNGFEPDQVTTEPVEGMDGFDPQHGSGQGRIPLPEIVCKKFFIINANKTDVMLH